LECHCWTWLGLGYLEDPEAGDLGDLGDLGDPEAGDLGDLEVAEVAGYYDLMLLMHWSLMS